MRPYEVVIIFDATLDETVIRDTTDAVVEFVRSRGGVPGQVDRWGRRPFAYELKHRTEGYYVFIELNGEPALLSEVDRMLSLSDDVLRHRVLRRPDAPKPVAPKTKPAASKPAAEVAVAVAESEGATAE